MNKQLFVIGKVRNPVSYWYDPDIDAMTVRITNNGAVAWVADPVSWPRLYLVELPEL